MMERNGSEERWAEVFIFPPEEQVIGADGSASVFGRGFVIGSDREFTDKAVAEFMQRTGLKVTRAEGNNSRSEFFFSESRWNAPWNPEGPKPNWRVNPPADPSLN